ncbi:MAG: lipoprotein-releasing system transmembrane subunit LolC [Rhodospirillaceae bacterium]|nr:lipoprotein-releasing system transmembrane subunit LolC [Rhodospirillaceae bacterium]|tara:strand:+ start:1192 stop:2445 length:1254 start_codon:yes stop_codon:yes gene_type:complete
MIFSAFERTVARRYLRARRREGFISVIAGFSLAGIGLGVATLIIVMAVMNGFRAELMGRILGLNGHLGVSAPFTGGLADFDAIANRLRGIDGVVRVTPIIEGQAMATISGAASGALVRGIRPVDIRKHPALSKNIVQGDLKKFTSDRDIVVGHRFAERYGLRVGSMVTLIAPRSRVTAFGSVPRVKSFRVRAVFEIGMYEYDNSFLFTTLKAARSFFKTGSGKISSLEVMLTSPDLVKTVRRQISEKAKSPVRIVDWQRTNASFFNAIQVERNVMFLILTLIIVVAAFNVISGLIMMVNDKGRDIAILRTMGATRGMIMRIFLLSGMAVGVFGTVAGFVLGLAFSLNIETIRQWLQTLTDSQLFQAEIYFLSQLPAKVDPVEVAAVTGMALGLSFLATLYPSWRAGRLDPVEALRYE